MPLAASGAVVYFLGATWCGKEGPGHFPGPMGGVYRHELHKCLFLQKQTTYKQIWVSLDVSNYKLCICTKTKRG